ncbi:Ppx/GppA phosphatase [Geothermobacter ehrlichii]|uniref:Ppx/GppA phosphatase n=1 Tax=Geothermobacter ehrlichii TaxID=213224 RepID=A0A5D3WP49_9BACT|nr:exopolyphosphatase [Geothermobacter ehrlichii]TYP00328.1 Ppx/GppA phosphatase [Geothermobacter ehrlichii]
MNDTAPTCVIDIGSNTLRMLVATVRPARSLELHCYRQMATRLAAGLNERGVLGSERMALAIDVLRSFLTEAAAHDPKKIVILATEAVRRAKNGEDFVRQVRADTGVRVRILDPEQEARLSCFGALSGLDPAPEKALVFDLGGGSLELAFVDGGRLRWHDSLPLGVVRLAEATGDLLARETARMKRQLHSSGVFTMAADSGCRLIGTAGTVTTLAALHLGLAVYEPGRVNGLRLSREQLLALKQRLAPLRPREREALPGMEAGRGDLILPGLEVVLRLMAMVRKEEITVSDRGLLEGAALGGEMFD